MTAQTEDRDAHHREGKELAFPVAASEKIFGGALTCVNANGYALEGSDTAGLIFQGVATARADNSSGLNGDIDIVLRRRGLVKVVMDTAITQANVGDEVFLVDDQTVDLVANVTNNIFCGVIAEYLDTTHAMIDIEPAIVQADVATHIADTTGAHAASAISVADAGTFTDQTEVEAALQEIYQHLLSAQKFIQIMLGDLIETDATNVVARLGVSTTPVLDMANGDTDSGLLVTWVASNSDAVLFQTPLPPDLDVASDLVIHFRAKSGGATDTPTIAADSYFNEGDTKVEDVSSALGAAYAENTITIAAADIPAGAQTLTVELTPGAHTTDTVVLSAIWIEYTAVLLTA
jgi:hypothetical protein